MKTDPGIWEKFPRTEIDTGTKRITTAMQEDSFMGSFTDPCVVRTAIRLGRKAVCLGKYFRTILNRSKKSPPGFKDGHEPCCLEILAITPDALAIGLSLWIPLLKVVFKDASH